jgi:tetratricopeptide (TPR) repeat protein
MLLAQLRAEALAPGAVMQKAVAIGSSKDKPADERRAAWAVAAQAAQALGNMDARIAALERGLALAKPVRVDVPALDISADMLWDAYLRLGQDEGNALRLVVGDDQAWFAAAQKDYANDPVRARALYAVVAFDAFDQGHRNFAQWRFAKSIGEGPGGSAVLAALYLHSQRFAHVDSVPAPVRYMLADYALSESDIPLASKLMAGLDKPPPEADAAAWQLQRARVLILGGRIDAGIDALRKLLASKAKLDADHVLQVVFDLQTVGRNKAALEFFHALAGRPLDAEHQRELLYWMADSYKALGDHVEAARLYLQSAIRPGPFTMDPWAQTARFHAAQELAAAGLVADARSLYRQLLNATHDTGRQAVLRRALQQLLLISPQASDPGGSH